MEGYAAQKGNKVLIHAIIRMNLEDIMLIEEGQTHKATHYMIPFL